MEPSLDKEIDVLVALYNSQIQEVISVGSAMNASVMTYLAGLLVGGVTYYFQNEDKHQTIHRLFESSWGQGLMLGVVSVAGAFLLSFQRQILMIASRIYALEGKLISLTQHTTEKVAPEHLQFMLWADASTWQKIPILIFITDIAEMDLAHRDGPILTLIALLFAAIASGFCTYFRFSGTRHHATRYTLPFWAGSIFIVSFAIQTGMLLIQ